MNHETLDLEVRFSTEESGKVTGIASVWDEPDAYGDIVEKGAFSKSLAEHKKAGTRPLFFFNHRSDDIIGVWDKITETDKGLEVEGSLVTKTAKGSEAYELLKAGAINGLSIGFRTRGAKKGANGGRIVTDMELVEISLVPLPAAAKARVSSVKSAPSQGVNYSRLVGALTSATKALKVTS